MVIPLRGVLALLDKEVPAGTRAHRMPFGAELQADGRVRFRLWAPPHRQVRVELDGGERWPMRTPRRRAGTNSSPIAPAPVTRYRFVLPDGLRVPDPASRYQPEDVHGPSEVIDPAAYSLARRRLERPRLGRGRRLRTAHRRLHARGHVSGRDRQARPSGCARRHRDRDHADRRFSGPPQLGL